MTTPETYAQLQAILNNLEITRHGVASLIEADTRGEDPFRVFPWSRGDVDACHSALEDTYLVRLYATFENAARAQWIVLRGKETHPTMQVVIERLAARLSIPSDQSANAHRVRKRRNAIVHGGQSESLSLRQSLSFLNHFISFFPPDYP